MVNTREMLPDEYSHYTLRYAAIRSGFAEYNLRYPTVESGRDECLASVLESSYEGLFDILMDDLEDFEPDTRVKALDYFIEQIARFDNQKSCLAS